MSKNHFNMHVVMIFVGLLHYTGTSIKSISKEIIKEQIVIRSPLQ